MKLSLLVSIPLFLVGALSGGCTQSPLKEGQASFNAEPPDQSVWPGYTPLMLAAYHGDASTVKILLDRGADTVAVSEDGSDALDLAVREGHTQVVSLLLRANAPLNRRNKAGNTPLIAAVVLRHINIAGLLLDAGADPNVATLQLFRTPLMLATIRQDSNIVTVLLRHGADPNMKDSAGRTAIEMALELQDLSLARILKQSGERKSESRPQF